MSKPWLAVTVHDRAGRILPGVERTVERLSGLFAGVAVAATDRSDERILAALADRLHVISSRHAPGDDMVGRARRESLRLALDTGAESVFYLTLITACAGSKRTKRS